MLWEPCGWGDVYLMRSQEVETARSTEREEQQSKKSRNCCARCGSHAVGVMCSCCDLKGRDGEVHGEREAAGLRIESLLCTLWEPCSWREAAIPGGLELAVHAVRAMRLEWNSRSKNLELLCTLWKPCSVEWSSRSKKSGTALHAVGAVL